MSSSRDRRLNKELQDIRNDYDNSGVYAEPISDSNFTRLQGSFPAPPDTPYAGGVYSVDIRIPDTYPFKAPEMKFNTRIWHPNVSSQTGAICLDTLGSNWTPVQTIKTALLSLRMLLECPNPKDPQDAEVAKMMLNEPQRFARTAHEWAVKYAGAPPQESFNVGMYAQPTAPQPTGAVNYHGYNPALIGRFTSMGFPPEQVVDAFLFVGIERNNGRDYTLEEGYVGDITARLLGEQ